MNREWIRNILWKLRVQRVAGAVNRGAVLVLMYHGIVPQRDSIARGDRVAAADLDWQIAYIRDHFDVRHVHEWIEGASPHEKPGAAVTFDDGYRSVLSSALPILQRHGCPATVYLCPGAMAGGGHLWFDELYCILRTAMEPAPGSIAYRYEALVEELKRLPPDRVRERVEKLRKDESVSDIGWTDDCELLTWHDVDRLRASGLVSFGAHTLEHVCLSTLSADEKQSQVAGSYQAVRNHAGACPTFAYPNGLPADFDVESQNIVRACGMVGAVTAIPGLARRTTNPYAWPRLGVPSDATRPRFELRAAGIFGERV